MVKATLLLTALLVIGVMIASSAPAGAQGSASSSPRVMAQGEYPDVSSLQPFTQAANFMSLPGYLRWQAFRDQNLWLTYREARRIVLAEGGRLYRRA